MPNSRTWPSRTVAIRAASIARMMVGASARRRCSAGRGCPRPRGGCDRARSQGPAGWRQAARRR
jgi:hypothetical protein